MDFPENRTELLRGILIRLLDSIGGPGGESLTTMLKEADDSYLEEVWAETCRAKSWHRDLVTIREYLKDVVEVETDSPGHSNFTADYVHNAFGIGEALPALTEFGIEDLLRTAGNLDGKPRLVAFTLLRDALPAE